MNKFKKIMSGIALTTALSLVFTASVDAKQYTVKKGDTLYSIARKNGTTVNKIVQDNKIANGVIKPGQVLNVGVAPVIADAVNGQHKVAAGDTLYSIAKKNGLTLDELKKINNLSSNYVPVGRVLNVVKPEAVATTQVETTVTTQAPKSSVTTNAVAAGQHKIAKGDTLYSIAKKNGLTLDELKKINNLSSNYVAIGTVLNVTKPVEIVTTTAPKAETTTKKVETTKVTTTSKQTEVAKTTTKVPVTTTAPTTVTTTKKVETTKATTTAKKAETTKAPVTTQVPKVVTTTEKKETKAKPAEVTTTKKVTTTEKTTSKATTKKVEEKPTTTTTTKKVENVPGATFKDKKDQELWNKVANNYKTDPTVKGLQPRVAQMKQYLGTKFGVKDFSLYRPGDYDGTGHGHGDGLALDLMVPVGGKLGDDISDYLVKNYSDMGIYYLIWKQQFYMDQNNIYGPANTWNWMPDRGSITQNHYDHVHISFKK